MRKYWEQKQLGFIILSHCTLGIINKTSVMLTVYFTITRVEIPDLFI